MENPLNKYTKIKCIGQGSYGKVYLMRNNITKELVVVKQIPIKENDKKSLENAKKEARVLSMLSHPNVIMYYDSFLTRSGNFCIVLEYADGQDLQKYIETHKEISERQVLRIFTQLILGLDYIHSQNILHRDIKTANIFLFHKGLVKLGDFGIALEVKDGELARTQIGTPYFMSPELLKGEKYGFPSDVWAAGCVLFELLTHHHAFTGTNKTELFSNIMAGHYSEMPKQYSKPLCDLCFSMLVQDPSKRPTCRQILETPILQKGFEELQQALRKNAFILDSQQPPRSKNPIQIKSSSSRSEMDESDELLDPDQKTIPEWLNGNTSLRDELIRQSQRHQIDDQNRVLGVVRVSISRISAIGLPKVTKITGKVPERRAELERDARAFLGPKYEIAYQFIKENGQNRREALISELGISQVPEKEFKMIETICAIDAYE